MEIRRFVVLIINNYAVYLQVLIGARKDSNGKYFFLAQNSWFAMPFVELSGEYLMQCEGVVAFVDKPISASNKRRIEMKKTFEHAVECVDVPDSYPLELSAV